MKHSIEIEQVCDIEMENVSFAYDGGLPILQNVNLKVRHGDFMAILGPNGGGKSTLLKLILGILKPVSGKITIFGETPDKAVKYIGYMPQYSGISERIPVSVMDVALMGRIGLTRWGWKYSASDINAAHDALERVQMLKYKNQRINTLSGGQRQRVYIARALVTDPKILLLDEPTASVDVEGKYSLYEDLKEMNKEMTVIVVSHDLSILSGYIKSVSCVNRTLHFHEAPQITENMIHNVYREICPVEIVAHGVPHRVMNPHED